MYTPTACRSFLLACSLFGLAVSTAAQQTPSFTRIQGQTNQEMLLTLSAPTGLSYRIDASTNLTQWETLSVLATNRPSILHLDSSAPIHPQRFYRAEQLAGTNILTGDYLVTDAGEAIIHPVNHATMVLAWNSLVIYVDAPQNGPTVYKGMPKPDVILITHDHGDHYDAAAITALRRTNTVLVTTKAVYSLLPAALKPSATVLTNGASASVLGFSVEAVPAYNTNHPKGQGNGYILTLGGQRIYISGDTGDTPEMKALQNIDVAFLCCDGVYNMKIDQAAAAARAFRPRIVYPYHNLTANLNTFKQLVGSDLGIEVRIRKWE